MGEKKESQQFLLQLKPQGKSFNVNTNIQL